MVIYNHSKGKVGNKMKMNLVEELHKETEDNSYTRSTYMVGRYEVCIDDAAYADGRTLSCSSM